MKQDVTMSLESHSRLVRERDEAIALLIRLGHSEAAQRVSGGLGDVARSAKGERFAAFVEALPDPGASVLASAEPYLAEPGRGPVATCKHRGWTDEDNANDAPFPSGPECGAQASFLACTPVVDTPVCCAHACRCRKPLVPRPETPVPDACSVKSVSDEERDFRAGWSAAFEAFCGSGVRTVEEALAARPAPILAEPVEGRETAEFTPDRAREIMGEWYSRIDAWNAVMKPDDAWKEEGLVAAELLALVAGKRPDETPRAAYEAAQKVGPYRVGRKLGRTLYLDGKCIGMVDDDATARLLAGAANLYLQQVAPLSVPTVESPEKGGE